MHDVCIHCRKERCADENRGEDFSAGKVDGVDSAVVKTTEIAPGRESGLNEGGKMVEWEKK